MHIPIIEIIIPFIYKIPFQLSIVL